MSARRARWHCRVCWPQSARPRRGRSSARSRAGPEYISPDIAPARAHRCRNRHPRRRRPPSPSAAPDKTVPAPPPERTQTPRSITKLSKDLSFPPRSVGDRRAVGIAKAIPARSSPRAVRAPEATEGGSRSQQHAPNPESFPPAAGHSPAPDDECSIASESPSTARAPDAPPARRDRAPECPECP